MITVKKRYETPQCDVATCTQPVLTDTSIPKDDVVTGANADAFATNEFSWQDDDSSGGRRDKSSPLWDDDIH